MLCIVGGAVARCKAVAVELGASAIISGLVAYLATSGITYVADGGTVQDIIDSISTQIEPWAADEYGSLEGFYGDVRSLSSPLGILNGSLSISSGLSSIYDKIRTWLIDNVFSSTDSVTVDSISVPGSTYTARLSSGGAAWVGLGDFSIISFVPDLTSTYPYDTVLSSSPDSIISIPRSSLSTGDNFLRLSCYPSNYYWDFYILNTNNRLDLYFRDYSSSNYITIFSNTGLYTAGTTSTLKICISKSVTVSGASSAKSGFLFCVESSSGDTSALQFYPYGIDAAVDGVITPVYTLSSDYDSSVSVPLVASGESLTVSTDTTMIQGLDAKLDAVLAAVQAGTGAMDGMVEQDAASVAPAVYQDGSAYALDLTSFFPFCIPWDLYRMTQLFVSDPVAPSITWSIPLPNGGTYDLVMDLSSFDTVAAIARKMELLLFVVGLAIATKRLIKW